MTICSWHLLKASRRFVWVLVSAQVAQLYVKTRRTKALHSLILTPSLQCVGLSHTAHGLLRAAGSAAASYMRRLASSKSSIREPSFWTNRLVLASFNDCKFCLLLIYVEVPFCQCLGDNRQCMLKPLAQGKEVNILYKQKTGRNAFNICL